MGEALGTALQARQLPVLMYSIAHPRTALGLASGCCLLHRGCLSAWEWAMMEGVVGGRLMLWALEGQGHFEAHHWPVREFWGGRGKHLYIFSVHWHAFSRVEACGCMKNCITRSFMTCCMGHINMEQAGSRQHGVPCMPFTAINTATRSPSCPSICDFPSHTLKAVNEISRARHFDEFAQLWPCSIIVTV